MSSTAADVIELHPPAEAASGDRRSVDAALVLAARAGDRKARQALFRRHAPAVNDLALRLAPWPDEADDIVQDAFVEALDRLGRLREPRAFADWLRTIVVRTAAKRLRRHRLRERLGLGRRSEVPFERLISPTAPPEVVSELRELYLQLAELPSQPRLMFVLRRVEGLTVAAIAEQTGVSTSTVKRRLAEAERRLERLRGAPQACEDAHV